MSESKFSVEGVECQPFSLRPLDPPGRVSRCRTTPVSDRVSRWCMILTGGRVHPRGLRPSQVRIDCRPLGIPRVH